MKKNINCQLVLTTCPNRRAANRIAHALVGERLAACVNIVPIAQSVYRWRGRVESASEFLLVIKSLKRTYKKLEKRLCALHPYELPEVIAVPITSGSRPYLAWIANPDKS